MIVGAFGEAFAKRVGLAVQIEERPDLMKKIGAGAVRLLRKARKPAQSFANSSIKLDKLADELEAKVERLFGLLDSLKREEREAQKTMVAHDEAASHWNAVMTLGASFFEALARVTGEHAVADDVRPTERRRAGIPDDAESVPPETDVTDADPTDPGADPTP